MTYVLYSAILDRKWLMRIHTWYPIFIPKKKSDNKIEIFFDAVYKEWLVLVGGDGSGWDSTKIFISVTFFFILLWYLGIFNGNTCWGFRIFFLLFCEIFLRILLRMVHHHSHFCVTLINFNHLFWYSNHAAKLVWGV